MSHKLSKQTHGMTTGLIATNRIDLPTSKSTISSTWILWDCEAHVIESSDLVSHQVSYFRMESWMPTERTMAFTKSVSKVEFGITNVCKAFTLQHILSIVRLKLL